MNSFISYSIQVKKSISANIVISRVNFISDWRSHLSPTFKLHLTHFRKIVFVMIFLVLSACSGSDSTSQMSSSSLISSIFDAKRQLTLRLESSAAISNYAAARFLEQATFGYTATDVVHLQQIGMSAWIDEQLALPASKVDWSSVCCYDINLPFDPIIGAVVPNQIIDLAVSAPDQLRMRATWSFMMFIPITRNKVQSPGQGVYFNFMQSNALGMFGDFLNALTTQTAMSFFLDLWKNQNPGSCSGCDFNENYPRELMQLFTLGTVLLNQDGTPKIDSSGNNIPTYTQADVSALARALSGWQFNNKDKNPSNSANNIAYEYPMVASYAKGHDTSAKTILGSSIDAGGTAPQDLAKVVDILMNHANIAPFVSTRLIQNLVMSQPSPAYVGRVAQVFTSSRGDMKQVIKTILLDQEARAGDTPSITNNTFGKIREPFLFATQVWRSLGCKRAPIAPWSSYNRVVISSQQPMGSETVFGFYEPNYAPVGAPKIAPESKLDDANILGQESNILSSYAWTPAYLTLLTDAGCDINSLINAYPNADNFLNLVNLQFFKGAMPSVLHDGAMRLMQTNYAPSTPTNNTNNSLILISLLLGTPSFGVMK